MTDMLLRILGGLILLAVLVIAFFAWTLRPLDMDAVSQQWMTEQDRFVTVDGEDWRVRESGPGRRADPRPDPRLQSFA
jgi:hypothetical protein